MASGEPFYLDPTFWVAGSTTVFVVGVIAKGVFKKLGASLDAKSKEIAAQLQEAKALRDEAERLLTDYQRKQREAEKDATAMLSQAEEDAKLLMQAAESELKLLVERRTRLAEEKIKQVEAAAVKDVKAKAAEIAVEATRQLLAENVKGKKADALIDAAIEDVASRLH